MKMIKDILYVNFICFASLKPRDLAVNIVSGLRSAINLTNAKFRDPKQGGIDETTSTFVLETAELLEKGLTRSNLRETETQGKHEIERERTR